MKNWNEVFLEETQERKTINPKTICRYGITPLNECLSGFARNELVVIGASSGFGKTEIGLMLAQHNALNGRRVGLFHLEGGEVGAIARLKWRDISKKYYERHSLEVSGMDFKKWLLNEIDDPTNILKQIELEVYEDYQQKYADRLLICPVKGDFSLRDLMFNLELDDALDLIIIDHLQYFSLAKAENEITEITKILREVKKITEVRKIPVVLISHLRKRQGRDSGIPNVDDFYGSSNIPKISDTTIIVAPVYNSEDLALGQFGTAFRIVKSRVGIRPNYIMLCNFHLNTRTYDNTYEMHRLDGRDNIVAEPLKPFELPMWAKSARNAEIV